MVKCSGGEENDFNRTVPLMGVDTEIHSYAEGGARGAMAGSSDLVKGKVLLSVHSKEIRNFFIGCQAICMHGPFEIFFSRTVEVPLWKQDF